MFAIRMLMTVLLLAAPARGDVPKVVADIAPVQSLVAMVMSGLGAPDLIVSASDSAHGGALRPSQARALQGADLVVWIGPELTPWLGKPLQSLAMDAEMLDLMAAPQTHLLGYRDGAGSDPHVWLDPENGHAWLGVIADRLAQMDPQNAAMYRDNATRGQVDLAGLQSEIAGILAPIRGTPYVTYHDAYQYFESRFGLIPVGSITSGDAVLPGPADLAALREDMAKSGVTCAFSEAGVDPGLLYAAAGDKELKLTILDPLGRELDQGPTLYPELLRATAETFVSCVGRE